MQFATVILSYNHPEITKRCLQSVLQQRSAEQVYLVHNGSTLQNRNLLQTEFPQVQHLTLPENRGFTGGTNFGLLKAFEKSEWVLFITNDCQLISIGGLPEQPGLYAPLIHKRNSERVDSLGGELNLWNGRLRHRFGHLESLTLKNGKEFYVPGTAFLLHRQIFADGFRFDESLGTYWEDVDFSIRLRKAGIQCHPLPSIQLKHAIGKTCHRVSLYTTYYYQRNKGIVSRRHTQGIRRLSFECHYSLDIAKRALRFTKKRKWLELKLLLDAYKDSWRA